MDLKKRASSFRIVGNAKITKNTFNLNEENKDKTWIKNSMYLGVDCGDGNVVRTVLSGGFSPSNAVVYVTGKKEDGKTDYSNRFQIDWDDRNDESLLETVGDDNFIKISIDLDENGDVLLDNKGNPVVKKFITEYDAVEYLKNNLNNGQKVCIVGKLEYSSYGVKKNITGVYISKDDRANEATFTQTLLLKDDCVGKFNKDTQTVEIFGYAVDYVGKVKKVKVGKNVAFPVSFEYDVSRLENDSEKIKKAITMLFGVGKGKVREIDVQGVFIEGVKYKELTVADLPKELRALIEIGAVDAEEMLKNKVIKSDDENDKRMVIKAYAFKKSTDKEGNSSLDIHCKDDIYKVSDIVTYEEALEEIGLSQESETIPDSNVEDDNSETAEIPEDLLAQLFNNV